MAIVVASPFSGWLAVPFCNRWMGGWQTEEKRVPNMSIKSTGRRTQVKGEMVRLDASTVNIGQLTASLAFGE
ncbi:hypothetical protein D5086_029754 [Populus alba]|uniref:Uncharacterized protein n=1 Tax=Populus alba TaxID=43335 RepID=A0ACC4AUE8_POPAL